MIAFVCEWGSMLIVYIYLAGYASARHVFRLSNKNLLQKLNTNPLHTGLDMGIHTYRGQLPHHTHLQKLASINHHLVYIYIALTHDTRKTWSSNILPHLHV
jgi:hypothetical protein